MALSFTTAIGEGFRDCQLTLLRRVEYLEIGPARVQPPGPRPTRRHLMDAVDRIPVGRCQCGCGGATPIARKTNRARGHIKGQPTRCIPGHKALGPIYTIEDRGYQTPCWIWQRAT